MTQITLTGGCQCGRVRYECRATREELLMFKCHCRDCQRLSGAPYCPVIYMPASAFRLLQGTVHHHVTPGEAGPHQRGFCAGCGSRLTGGEGPGATGIGVTAASLDDPGFFRPQMEVWVGDAQPWDPLDPALPHFAANPPAG